MDLSATTIIDRPPEEVFDYVVTVSHDSEWRTGVVEAGFNSDDPLHVGSNGYDRVEANGREMTAEWTIYQYEPGVLARWTLDNGPFEGTGGYLCEADGARTKFTLEAHVTPTGWYRLIGPMFGRIGRRQNLADVERLRTILEAAA